MQEDLTIIIPAAGLAKRMKSYGSKSILQLTPKETIIDHQQRVVKQVFPHAKIVVVLGYDMEEVVRHIHPNVQIVENESYETTNVVRSLSIALRASTTSKVMIVYGDLVFNKAAIDILDDETMAVIDSRGYFDSEEIGVNIINGYITQFSYDMPIKWAQIVYLTGRELELFKQVVHESRHKKWFGFEALNLLLNMGGSIKAIEPQKMIIGEADTPKQLDLIRRLNFG